MDAKNTRASSQVLGTSSLQDIQDALNNISSTSGLVATLNSKTSAQTDKVIYQRLFQEYTYYFSKMALSKIDETDIIEYSRLAQARLNAEARQADLLHGYFETWRTKLDSGDSESKIGLGTKHVLRALDPLLFGHNIYMLHDVCQVMLERLPDDPSRYIAKTYIRSRDMLISTCQALIIMRQVHEDSWSLEKKDSLYARFKEKLRVVRKSEYYPYHFQATLLAKSLELNKRLLEAPGKKNPTYKGARIMDDSFFREENNLFEVEEGISDVVYALCPFSDGKDSDDIEKDLKLLLGGCSNNKDPPNEKGKKWYEWLKSMAYAAACSLEEKKGQEYFIKYFEVGLQNLPGLGEEEERDDDKENTKENTNDGGGEDYIDRPDKSNSTADGIMAMRYAVVQQLTSIALRGKTPKVRVRAVTWIASLLGIERRFGEDAGWKYDKDLVHAMLTALAVISIEGKKQVASMATINLDTCITDARNSGKGRKKYIFLFCAACNVRGETPATLVLSWIGKLSQRTKVKMIKQMREETQRKKQPAGGGDGVTLYSKVTKEVKKKFQKERELHKQREEDARSSEEIEGLLSRYYQKACKYMPSMSGRKRTFADGYVEPVLKRDVPNNYYYKRRKNMSKMTDELVLRVLKSPRSEVENHGNESAELLGLYESVTNSQTTLRVEDIFNPIQLPNGDKGIPRCVLLKGPAGSGKTTLCTRLVYRWAIQEWARDVFDAVYMIPVRKLKPQWKSLSEAIVNLLLIPRKGNTTTRNSSLSRTSEKKKGNKEMDEEDVQRRSCLKREVQSQIDNHLFKVLLVLDGLDECRHGVDHLLSEAEKCGKNVHRLWTSITEDEGYNHIEEGAVDLYVSIGKFSGKSIRAFVQKYFHEELVEAKPTTVAEARIKTEDNLDEATTNMATTAQVLSFINKNSHIQMMASVPFQLEMICALCEVDLFQPQSNGKDDGSAIMTATVSSSQSSSSNSSIRSSIPSTVASGSSSLGKNNTSSTSRNGGSGRRRRRRRRRGTRQLMNMESLSAIFYRIFRDRWANLRSRRDLFGEELCEDDMEIFLQTLGYLSMRQLDGYHEVLKTIQGAESKMKSSYIRAMLENCGFVRYDEDADQGGAEPHVVHTLYKEFFAGVALARLLTCGDDEKGREAREFIKRHKYNFTRRRMLQFMAGELFRVLEGSTWTRFDRIVGVIDTPPIEVVGLQHLVLKLKCIHECLGLSSGKFEEYKSMSKDLITLKSWAEAGLRAVARAELLPEIDFRIHRTVVEAVAVLPSLLRLDSFTSIWIPGCSHHSENVRIASAHALGELVNAYPEVARKAVGPLIALLLNDTDPDVRSCAVQAVRKVGVAAPLHAFACLKGLINGCADEERQVWLSSVHAFGDIVEVHYFKVVRRIFPTLLAYTKDAEWTRRRGAVAVLPAVARVNEPGSLLSPEKKQLFNSLIDACDDKVNEVKILAMASVGRIVMHNPLYVSAALKPLVSACKDWRLRRIAVATITRVVKADKTQASLVLQPLIIAATPHTCSEEEEEEEEHEDRKDIRWSAIVAITGVLKADKSHAKVVLKPLLAACRDKDWRIRRGAIPALPEVIEVSSSSSSFNNNDYKKEGFEKHAALKCLIAAGMDEDWHVRKLAVAAFGDSVKRHSVLAQPMRRALVMACKDEDWRVRRSAVPALVDVVQVDPYQAIAVMQPLIQACSDEDVDVRVLAVDALGRIVQIDPSQASDVVRPLLTCSHDEEVEVRRAAMTSIAQVISMEPAKCPLVLRTLLAACMKEQDKSAWIAAVHAFGVATKADLSRAKDSLKKLITAYDSSEEWLVRRGAVFAMSEIAKAKTFLASTVLQSLGKACSDEDHDVRKVAAAALGEVVKNIPEIAEHALKPILQVCHDEDAHVRDSAELALAEIMKADPNQSLSVLQYLGFTGSDDDMEDDDDDDDDNCSHDCKRDRNDVNDGWRKYYAPDVADEEEEDEDEGGVHNHSADVRRSALQTLHHMQVRWLISMSTARRSRRNLASLVVMHRLVSTPLTMEQLEDHNENCFKITLHDSSRQRWAMSECNTKSMKETVRNFKELCIQ